MHSSTLAEIEFNMQGNIFVHMTAYIPHDQVAEETRAQNWDSLEHRTLEIPEAKNLIIVGDFNSALHTRKQGEEDVLGPNIYGKGAEHLQRIEDRMADETRNNRMYLLDYLRTTGAIHANTFFEKPWDKKLTWKSPATQGFAPPWNPERFAELDICIVRDIWKNTITNVQSDIRTNIDSDHIALHVNIRQKLKKLEEETPDNSLKGIKLLGEKNGDTSDTVRVKYLDRAKVYLKDSTNMDEASNALWKAASETPDTRKKGMGKRETHPEIKAILDDRQRAVNDFNQQEIRRLTNKLKRKAKPIRSKRIV